ncbi:transposase [Streptomyces sp. NPDC058611]|uniref:transposase n=1 Tax=unclassified Streptomyces TaxID=2593676 RepID=UPI00365D2E77
MPDLEAAQRRRARASQRRSWPGCGRRTPCCSKPSRSGGSFTPEFKAEIVELYRWGDRSVGQIAKDFDLTETALWDWVKQAEVDTGERNGLTSSDREELRRENHRLREGVDILKRATAFFANETR